MRNLSEWCRSVFKWVYTTSRMTNSIIYDILWFVGDKGMTIVCGLFIRKKLLRGGLEMVPAGPHKPCNVGSNPSPATLRTQDERKLIGRRKRVRGLQY